MYIQMSNKMNNKMRNMIKRSRMIIQKESQNNIYKKQKNCKKKNLNIQMHA